MKMHGATMKIAKCAVYRGGCTVKLIKLKLQNLSLARAPSKALDRGGGGANKGFNWPFVFVIC
jgi:hypothetical protein